MSSTLILLSILLGAVGIAYITYGKTQRKAIPLLGGVVLLVMPYFSSQSYLLIAVLILVIVLSYFFNI